MQAGVIGKLLTENSLNRSKFASWHPNAEKGSLEFYSGQIYDKGQRCWNGPDRSAHVELVCGTSNAILSVAEP